MHLSLRLAVLTTVLCALTPVAHAQQKAPQKSPSKAPAAPAPAPELTKGVGYPAIDSIRLIADLSALSADSMDGRKMGSAGNIRARAYILRQFQVAGLAPFAQRYTYPFTALRPGGTTQGTNLIGFVEGTRRPDRYIVLSAHFDHLGSKNGVIYNGADDNASGTAGVLAIARWLKDNPPENSIIIALFDGEEQGLLGSNEFVNHSPVALDKIAADVNLDMIGRNARGELWAAGATPWIVMHPLLDAMIPTAPVTLKLGHDSGTGKNNWTQQSDQGPFHVARIPWVYFGVEDHPDYHQPGDKFAKIPPGFFVSSVRTIAEFVRRLDRGIEPVVAAKLRGPAGK